MQAKLNLTGALHRPVHITAPSYPWCRWIHALPGSSQYTAAFTTASDQDVKRIIARHLRPLFCDPEQGFKQLRHNLDPSFLQILKFAEQRLLRDRKSSTRLSSQVDMLAQDCHSVRHCIVSSSQAICPVSLFLCSTSCTAARTCSKNLGRCQTKAQSFRFVLYIFVPDAGLSCKVVFLQHSRGYYLYCGCV